MELQSIGVIGAGQMGNGIAHVAAQAGCRVHLMDVNEEALTGALAIIAKNLDRQIRKNLIDGDEKDRILGRIGTGTAYEPFGDCDIVIEAATENEDIKKAIFKELCPHLKAEALVATNTSSISVTRLATYTDRPGSFIGMHFMNPVPVMKLVEVIRGIATEDNCHAAVLDLTRRMNKTTASSEDFPAFIVNRILLPMINEAVYTLYEGVGTVKSIDTALKLGANHPMGPLQLADFIGLDTCLSIMQVLYDGLADTKYRPCPLLVKYVEAGWHGRKSGRGFYDYGGDEPVPTR